MKEELIFEETLHDEFREDLELVEVPLTLKPLLYAAAAVLLVGGLVMGRIIFLSLVRGGFYAARAEANLSEYKKTSAPRGIITDRSGKVLAENRPVFSAVFNIQEFLQRRELQEKTLEAIKEVLGLAPQEVWDLIGERDLEKSLEPILLSININQSQLIALQALSLPTLTVVDSFERVYQDGPIFSSLLGYIGLPSIEDLRGNPKLSGQELVGKTGLESLYDDEIRGKPGVSLKLRDAKGGVLGVEKKNDPQAGEPLNLTIDADFQSYFYKRMQEELFALGREAGAGIAVNPQNGEILAMLSLPAFDNNIFTSSGQDEEKRKILNDPWKPLFNRAISGLYAPGSTIKPLVAVAALKEGVIDAKRTIFSPGYLDIPNPYNPDEPTRYLDWRYQGDVDLTAAIAQSSNVYFYTVGGGAEGIRGLGINRLYEWWQKFRLGTPTGIDLPGEARGFLPSIEWKEKNTGKPWLLGDTYNVSIGQGDLLVTPIQLLSYISAIANGGKIYQPFLNKNSQPRVSADLSNFSWEIKEVQKGMIEAVTKPLGTAHLLADLAVSAAAKTGSAQIQNNKAENAFFVGYAPASADATAGKSADKPQIAILVLVEKSREGSLNAVPIAKDVLNWYYWNRIVKH
jgi:penicillin-binding protein 2